jgi:very-short-patch-repair endonuclease
MGDLSGPFPGSHAVSEGVLTRKQLRSPLLRRLFQNSYCPAGIPVTHELRCRAAAVVAPKEAVLTGCSAAVIRGLPLVEAHEVVEFVIPEGVQFAAQRGMNIRRTRRGEIDSEPWQGIGLASAERMTLDILTNTRLHRSLPRVVGYLDAILRAGLVDRPALDSLVRSRQINGIVRARRALGLSDPRAESIPESELRVQLVIAGLAPEVQLNVYDEFGTFLGRLDLAFPEFKLAVEYDGEWHGQGDQPVRDQRRRAALEAAGWAFVIVTKDQLYGDPRALVATIQRALLYKSALLESSTRAQKYKSALPWTLGEAGAG